MLTHVAVDRKENEIVAVFKLLRQLDLTSMVVVGDAMQAQRALSRQVVEAGGDYLWLVKENQPTLLADLELLFERPHLAKGWADPTTAQRVDKGHGRLEERTITVSRMLREYVDWPYLDQVFRRERMITEAGQRTVEVRRCQRIHLCLGIVQVGLDKLCKQTWRFALKAAHLIQYLSIDQPNHCA